MDRSRPAVAALGLLFIALAVGPSTASSAEPSSAASIEDAIRFREELGLQADPQFVAATFNDSRYELDTTGVPLSADELEDLAERAKIREDFTPALARAIDSPGYAGAYIDQKRNGQPVILTTDPEALAAALRGVEESAAVAEVRVAEYSRAELDEVKAAVKAGWEELESNGVDIVSVGYDTSANRVLVGVNGLTEEVEAMVRSRFGAAVTVRDDRPGQSDACNVTDCWPMKGGLIYLKTNSAKYCTAGFMVRKTNSGALSLLTAGHCIELYDDSGIDEWGHNSTPADAVNIGYEAPFPPPYDGYNTWFNNSNADVALIVLDFESVAALNFSTLNALHIADPDSPTSAVGYVQPHSQQLEGDTVCRMGYGTYKNSGNVQGVTCGTITNENVDHDSCSATVCYNINHTWEMSFDSIAGDSGGPVFHQISPPSLVYAAYGTHVHSWTTGQPLPKRSWYSPITWGRAQYLSVAGFTFDVCVTGSC